MDLPADIQDRLRRNWDTVPPDVRDRLERNGFSPEGSAAGSTTAPAEQGWGRPLSVMGGSILGGILTAPGGPLGAVAGAGLGGGIGGQLYDMIAGPSGSPTKKALADVTSSAEGEMGGQVIGRLGQMGANAWRASRAAKDGGKLAADIAAADAAAARQGVPLTASERTLNKSVRRMENAPGYFPIGGGPVHAMRDASLERAKNRIAEIASDLAPAADDATGLGLRAQSSARKLMAKWRQTKAALFSSVEQAIGDEPVIGTQGFRDAAKSLNIKASSGLGLTPLGRKALKDALSDEAIPFQAARQLESELGSRAYRGGNAVLTMPQGHAAVLRKALSDSIDEFMTTAPATGDALAEAKQVYATGRDLFNNSAKRLVTGSRGQVRAPESVVDQVFKPGKITDTLDFKQLVDDDTYAEASRHWLEDKVNKAMTAGKFNPARFAKEMRPYVESGHIDVILPPEAASAVKDMTKVTGRMGAADALAANPSGTGQVVSSGAQLYETGRRALSGDYIGAAGVLAAPHVGAKAVTSKTGQDLLADIGQYGLGPAALESVLSPGAWRAIAQGLRQSPMARPDAERVR